MPPISSTTILQADLVRIFSSYGEIRNTRTLVRAIVSARNSSTIKTTGQLADIARDVSRGNEMKYLARVFQALRIEVNDELGALKELLEQSAKVLKTGGETGSYYLSLAGRQGW